MSPNPMSRPRRLRLALAGTLAAALLAACGGGGTSDGGGDDTPPPASCSVADQNQFLRGYFDDWYFWYALAPRPDPGGYATAADYFNALLYNGTDPAFPTDRWSGSESTESFNRFWGDGQTLGFGVSVAGLEVKGLPSQPLYVRYVEPLSPAAGLDVRRGDQVLEINGRSSADIITADDFDALTATSAGQLLTLKLRRAGIDRSVTISAAVFSLTPTPPAALLRSPLGRRVGYLMVKDMISQAVTPATNSLDSLKSNAAADLVLDLRYNGGGLVSVASTLAGLVGGTQVAGQTFASLLYNDKRASAYNEAFRFANPASPSAMNLRRVVVLTGRRTCSASEQLINGLRGAGVEVIAIGETTCGKPVGFLPRSDGCGTTYSVVNFESVNARNEGRYWDGFDATCVVAEDWTKAQGSTEDPLVAAALQRLDSGACPVAAQRERPLHRRSKADRVTEAGERWGMVPR